MIKNFLATLLVLPLITLSGTVIASSLVLADEYIPVTSEICAKAPDNPACTASNEDPITGNGIIITIANVIAWAAGAIAVVMIIFAGFRFVKSGGDPAKVTVARETIIYALIGLVVIVTARLIVGFVINRL